MENADFAGRVAVVTGAWRGLGRAAAARLHDQKYFQGRSTAARWPFDWPAGPVWTIDLAGQDCSSGVPARVEFRVRGRNQVCVEHCWDHVWMEVRVTVGGGRFGLRLKM